MYSINCYKNKSVHFKFCNSFFEVYYLLNNHLLISMITKMHVELPTSFDGSKGEGGAKETINKSYYSGE